MERAAKSVQRAGFAGEEAKGEAVEEIAVATARTDYEECLACQ
jgi:hypothetical protein